MATVDVFDETNGTALEDHTPPGAEFAYVKRDPDPGEGVLTIVEQRLEGSGEYDLDGLAPGPIEMQIEADAPSALGEFEAYIYFHYDGSGGLFGNSYAVNVYDFGTDALEAGISLFKVGGEIGFYAIPGGIITAGLHVVGVRVEGGNNIIVTWDGGEVINVVDDTPLDEGLLAIEQYQAGNLAEDDTIYNFISGIATPSFPATGCFPTDYTCVDEATQPEFTDLAPQKCVVLDDSCIPVGTLEECPTEDVAALTIVCDRVPENACGDTIAFDTRSSNGTRTFTVSRAGAEITAVDFLSNAEPFQSFDCDNIDTYTPEVEDWAEASIDGTTVTITVTDEPASFEFHVVRVTIEEGGDTVYAYLYYAFPI